MRTPYSNKKACLKLVGKFLLALLVFFLLTTQSFYDFKEEDTYSKTNAEQGNSEQLKRQSLRSSASWHVNERKVNLTLVSMQKHETKHFMETNENNRVEREASQVKTYSNFTPMEPFTKATRTVLKSSPHLNYKEKNVIAKYDSSQLLRIVPKVYETKTTNFRNGHNRYYDDIIANRNLGLKQAQSAYETNNQYENYERQSNSDPYVNFKLIPSFVLNHEQQFQAKFPLQHFKRKPLNIKQRNPLTNASKTSLQTEEKSPFMAIFNQMKMLWNLFEFFTWIWNSLAEYYQYSQQQQQQQQQKLQIQTEMHFKRLPQSTKNSSELTTLMTNSSGEELNAKIQAIQTSSSREKRQAKDAALKSYYDFVIVEASHKFWSILEVTTIIIIIYSTFAGLYFAKLNPLVSKHDYIDYLSGDTYFGNVRHAKDIDFDDDEDNDSDEDEEDDAKTTNARSIATLFEWLPSMSHSVKFIIEAIDKLPADLDHENTF